MIPQANTEAVVRALERAFGVTACEDIRTLGKCLHSALVYRIVVRGHAYLLRVIARKDQFVDPAQEFACMEAAAGAGLAPRIWYASAEDGVLITDFVEIRPFARTDALVRLPRVLRAIHELPAFPPPKVGNYFDALDGFVRRFQAARVLPDAEMAELFDRYAPLPAVYPRHDADKVSSHNDLKPENILFDGNRVWIADWEAAFLNDRYIDLAIVANFVVANDADERLYLGEYFGQEPDEYQLARFFLARQCLHMFFAAVFLLIGSAGRELETAADGPDFRDFHNRIWSGEIEVAGDDKGVQIAYGKAHWNQLAANLRTARFDDALATVWDNPGRAASRRVVRTPGSAHACAT